MMVKDLTKYSTQAGDENEGEESNDHAVESVKELRKQEYLEPWLRRDTDPNRETHSRIREFLDNTSDQEIINTYYRMRDEKVAWDGGYFYPNMQILFGTPFEREKDRREIELYNERYSESEITKWYKEAKEKSCIWWLENHIIARHAFHSCMSCGVCASLCPAAEFFDYNPRTIMETVQDKNEENIVELLKSETIWYCSQCGSCKPKCPRKNNPFAMISSLRQLSQLKGFHVLTVKGRQQYAGRHLWGGNLWNRACTFYFRNPDPETHKDFGPRFKEYYEKQETFFRRIGGCPDMDGWLSGRKVHPDTLEQVRRIWHLGGALYLWKQLKMQPWGRLRRWGLPLMSTMTK